MPTPLLSVPVLAFALGVLAHLAALRLFPKLNLLDFPERYGLKRARLPYPTGMLSVALFLILFPLFFGVGMREIGMLIAVAGLAIISFFDDRSPLPFRLRLSMQVLLAILLALTGSRIFSITNPFGGVIPLDTLNVTLPSFGTLSVIGIAFTVIWLLLTINSLNWFDGIPGQVSVLSSLGFLILGLLALLRNDQPALALLSFLLLGLSLSAAYFDCPPTKVLMGDTGSMFFGLMLGVLGVYQGGKVATAFLILGIPLLDALFVLMRRMIAGQSPFRGNQDHFHHRLLARGFSPRAIICLTAVIGVGFGGMALFLNTKEKAVAGLLLVLLVLMMTILSGKNPTSHIPHPDLRRGRPS